MLCLHIVDGNTSFLHELLHEKVLGGDAPRLGIGFEDERPKLCNVPFAKSAAKLTVLLRVSPPGGRLAARARVSTGLLRGDGGVARRAAVPDGAGASAGSGSVAGARTEAGAREGDDVSGSALPGEPFPGKAPTDEESPGEACEMSRFFFETSWICRRHCSIWGALSTLSTLVYSTGMLTLKSRTAVLSRTSSSRLSREA